jgi:choline dehydrogenase-like flavoprotein
VDGRYITKDTWFDRDGKQFQPQVHYFVGGATKLYGAALYRLRPEDFGEIKHADGISPAWPLSYGDFEPWYSAAERLYQVHGNAGEDPTEGPHSEPYPWPAVSHEPRLQQISDDLAQGGYRPFHAPCGIMLNEADRPRSTCIRCATCDGYPCLVHAKADAEVIAVRPLLGRPNVTLLTGAEVRRLETDGSGRTVTGVVVSRDGNREVYRGDIVAISAGAANSAKILLNSASDKHPNGLANGSDQGWDATTCSTTARRSRPCPRNATTRSSRRRWGSTTSTLPPRITSGRWATSRWSASPTPRPCGANSPSSPGSPRSGGLTDTAKHSVDFWLTTEDLPVPENRVTTDKDGNVHLTVTMTNNEEADRLYGELKKILNHTGMAAHHVFRKNFYMDMAIPLAGCAHQAGTCRFGTDPATSVLDTDCKAHELGQPVRRGHQLLPQHRRGEPGPDRHGQRPAGR